MDIVTVLRTIVRRWAIVLPIVALTLGAAFVVGSGTDPEYAADGNVLLEANAKASNPGALAVTAPVLAEAIRGADARGRMAAAGASPLYTVDVEPTSLIVHITSAGLDPAADAHTVNVVLDHISAELAVLEAAAGVAQAAGGQVQILSRPSDAGGQATGSAYLVAPGLEASNPYAAGDYTARVIQQVMSGGEAASRVAEITGGGASFQVTQQPRDTAPVLTINARGLDAPTAKLTFDAVVTVMSQVLAERQATYHVPDRLQTHVSPLDAPTHASRTSGTLVKSVVTIVGLGLIAAVTAAILLESVLVSRRSRRERARGSQPHIDLERSARPEEVRLPADSSDLYAREPGLRAGVGARDD